MYTIISVLAAISQSVQDLGIIVSDSMLTLINKSSNNKNTVFALLDLKKHLISSITMFIS